MVFDSRLQYCDPWHTVYNSSSSLKLQILYVTSNELFCPERALAPLARIFIGWRIKNPLDGPVDVFVFPGMDDDDICIQQLMADSEYRIHQRISRCSNMLVTAFSLVIETIVERLSMFNNG